MTASESLPSPAPVARRVPLWPSIILATVVLIFAFLAASFAARNSDVWQHLASGRLLAQNKYSFGSDPFAYTTSGAYWANHSWLFDLLLYAGHQMVGGSGLVILKAIAITVLAALMLRLAQPVHRDPRFWVGGLCIALAVLAMSPRLLLHPASASLFMLALCLWLLRTGGRALYFVPVLIAVWVNLDAWFLLGPIVVALFALGERFALAAPGARRLPLWMIPACLAACLLSPHHIFAFAFPAEVSPAVWLSDFPTNPRFAALFLSPWHWRLLASADDVNLSAWAFIILLMLSLISFAVHRPALRSWRLPIWLAFAVLACWQVRLVPFFAVVAGPITALNFRDRETPKPARRSYLLVSIVPTFLVCIACLILIALTWPGWLQGFHRRDRGLEWAIRTDPSLERVAGTLAKWREQNVLPPSARTFATHPDVAHYCAWFCPGERVFLDSRLPLFVRVADDFHRLCSSLDSAEPSSENTSRLLHDHSIACLVVYDPDLRRLGPTVHQVAQSTGQWGLLRVDGRAIVVAPKDASNRNPQLLDADRTVFASGGDEILPPAPGTGPTLLAQRPPWWARYLDRPSGSSWEASAAAIYVGMFEEQMSQQSVRKRTAEMLGQRAAIVGLAAGPLPAASEAVRLAQPGAFGTEPSAALPLLGVRAARRAVSAHPDAAAAWLALALAYLSLSQSTAEATSSGVLPPLAQIRRIQTVTALVQAVTLNPSLAPAHETLAQLYTEMKYDDLALRHRTAHLELARRAGRLSREEPPDFARRIERLEQTVEQLRNRVQDNENRFAVRSQSLKGDPLTRAKWALEFGLAGKAVDDVLLQSHADLYGIEGIRLLLEVLLFAGRAQDARDLLAREELRSKPDSLGLFDVPGGQQWRYRFPAYDWCDLCQSAAAGHYDRASSALERLRGRMKHDGDANRARLAPPLAVGLTAECGLAAAPEMEMLRLFRSLEREQLSALLVQNQILTVERADFHALEGMLLLERGLPDKAGEQFRFAKTLYDSAPATAPALPGRHLAWYYLKQLGP